MSQIDGLTKQTSSLKLLCTQELNELDGLTKQTS